MIKPFKIISQEFPGAIRSSYVLQKFDTWINRFSYKPNTLIRWGLSNPARFTRGGEVIFGNVFLDVVMEVVDSEDSGRIAPVTHRSTIDLEYLMAEGSFERFKDFVYVAIRDAEMHELEEFFKVDGKRIYDPHKNEKIR